MPDKEYLPFRAINVFVERDYLENVTKEILEGKGTLSRDEQTAFTSFFRKHVSVLGFRNPVRAPLSLQINAFASAFEQKEEVIPFTLTNWAKIKSDLAKTVKKWLESEGWEGLDLERQYDENEGFSVDWPDEFTFDEIEEKFKQAHPKADYDRDDLILMVLWISGRLPSDQSDL
jgi:hypothetical protein